MILLSKCYRCVYVPTGNLISETNTITGITDTTAYGYNSTGALIQITYPNGQVVHYQRDSAGNITQVSLSGSSDTVTLASNISHLPFGPINGLTLGNGIAVDRHFDQLYRMTENRAVTIQDHTYTRDATGHVTALNDTLDPGLNVALIYDDLYQLTFDNGTFGS